MSFLNKHDMLFQFQFGFREGHSTILALIEIIDNIKKSIDNNEYTIGIFLDLCKAFDTVDHSILLQKLKYYGIRGVAHSLISSYLSNCKQYSVINNVISECRTVSHGVPQGSVLGPLLFLIFINDLKYCIPEKYSRLFADDTGIFVSGKSIGPTIRASQTLLNKLHDWFKCNKLTVSVPKCAWMIFHGKNKHIPTDIPSLYLNNTAISLVDTYKYIGLILDSKLSWAPHVNSICDKLNIYFGVFYYLRCKTPQQLLRQVYFSTVFPRVHYGIELYGSCSQQILNKLQVKQNLLLKILSRKDRLYPTDQLHVDFKILKITDLYKVKLLSFVQDCLNENTIPLFYNYFTLQHSIHAHDTRNSLIISQPFTKTIIGHSAVRSMGATLWNNSLEARNNIRLSKSTFKKNITSNIISGYT